MSSEAPEPITSYLDRQNPRQHMAVPWHEVISGMQVPAPEGPLADKVTAILRTGQLSLSSGDSAWRVRDYMNRVGHVLGVTVHADISLVNIELTCIQGTESITEVAANASAGVNTERVMLVDQFVHEIEAIGTEITLEAYHHMLDVVECKKARYKPWQSGLAAGVACASFMFLLGGGPIEMVGAGLGAGCGQWTRVRLLGRKINQLVAVAAGVAVAGVIYLLWLNLLSLGMPDAMSHEAGYIGALLFVIPGFPLITSGFDLFQSEMRSGIERLVYALVIIVTATAVAWLVAETVQLYPDDFVDQGLTPLALTLLRIVASFAGVYGFSVMFNSTPKMCATAGCIGAVSNTLRLSLASFTPMAPEAAAFLGALCAGLLASVSAKRLAIPRTAVTVPSIVIMVPGLYMYRAVYYMGATQVGDAAEWLIRAVMIVLFLPIGLIAARVLTDPRWRRTS